VRLITSGLDLENGLGLEIGPSHNPLLSKSDGFNIRIADHLDEEGLKEKYSGQRPTGRIEKVDYVLDAGRLTASIPDRFDYIIASHVAEHTVCLISFLQDCQALLKPGGAVSLALPDKRYCFDRFRERTSLGRVVDVYRAGPTVHTEGSVLEHNLNHVRIDGKVAWSEGRQGPFTLPYTLDDARQRALSASNGQYVDTHNWVLTPNHFRLLVDDLNRLDFIQLRERSYHDTIDHEFFITLSVDGPGPGISREQLLTLSALEVMQPEPITFE
jgi:hypothetical protein